MDQRTEMMIEKILEVKEEHKYYREKQDYQAFDHLKMNYRVQLFYQKRQSSFLMMLLKKLKSMINDRGYLLKEKREDHHYFFQIRMDPASFEEQLYFFIRLKELMDFSQGYFQFCEDDASAITILFSKRGIFNKEKVHKRLISFLLEQNSFFAFPLAKHISCIWNYRSYLTYQMDHVLFPVLCNYLKRSEIEIKHVKVDLPIVEFKRLLVGLLYELFYENFSWREKMKLREHYQKSDRMYSFLEFLEQQAPVKKRC